MYLVLFVFIMRPSFSASFCNVIKISFGDRVMAGYFYRYWENARLLYFLWDMWSLCL